jgi:hypothetical protein
LAETGLFNIAHFCAVGNTKDYTAFSPMQSEERAWLVMALGVFFGHEWNLRGAASDRSGTKSPRFALPASWSPALNGERPVCRHGSPAMEAGLTDHVWTLEELISLLQNKENTMAA